MIYAKSVCPLKMNINCAISCCCPLQLPSTFCVRQINLKAATISEITNCERVVVGGAAAWALFIISQIEKVFLIKKSTLADDNFL